MIILSQITGNANVKAVAHGFVEADLLTAYYVSLAVFPGNLLDRISQMKGLSEIRRRSHDPELQPFTKTWPWVELGRMLAMRSGIPSLSVPPTSPFHVYSVIKKFDKHVAAQLLKELKNGAKAIYSYEDNALATFRRAKQLGLTCLYDLPIGYWRAAHRLLDEERERWPEWIPTLTGLKDPEEKLARKDEELALANHIFVASNFTASTLKEYPGKLAPVEVIPYGFPPVAKNRIYHENFDKRPLKLLFVGGLSQRKGVADLFAAVEAIGKHVELTVVGTKKNDECKPLNIALTKHRWIQTLPNEEILKLMRDHDVLIFASLFEGFGLVITEAMSQGTPVITTDRTIGPNFIEDGVNGWLIKAASTRALQDAIENILERRRDIPNIGLAAMETASQRPWQIYSNETATAAARVVGRLNQNNYHESKSYTS
ncbi:glycosyltransferase family 4 protein [Mucilaginibacter lacusdianchii]|uniref:glycosyltransferase family 4 protein n=1 Tax=Mucilaginibacter lacusdianchii TaxID=2684211 RepID=UPI00131B0409|nr:glycosyltransferase family 4 protein [Mucilaginibacter sp. JXJ CY 39]